MSLLPRLTRGSNDLTTPEEALLPILPYLPHRVWECAPGKWPEWRMVRELEASGRYVLAYDNHDFLQDEPPDLDTFCAIVTNPPFSTKTQFMARCAEIGKPWALLLPVTALGVYKCQRYLHDAEILFLPKRIDFTGKKAPWFAVAWFTWGLGIGRQITFVEKM